MNANAVIEKRAAIREALLDKGITIAGWARQHQVEPVRVYQTITRYGEGSVLKPYAPLVWKIIKQLKKDTGIDLMEEGR